MYRPIVVVEYRSFVTQRQLGISGFLDHYPAKISKAWSSDSAHGQWPLLWPSEMGKRKGNTGCWSSGKWPRLAIAPSTSLALPFPIKLSSINPFISPCHCTVGQNQVVLRHLIIHFPMRSGVSEWVSEQVNEWAQWSALEKRAVRIKQMNGRCEQAGERTSEWPGAFVSIHGCFEP